MIQLTRRDFLRLCGTSSIGLVLAACGVTQPSLPMPTLTVSSSTEAKFTVTPLTKDTTTPTVGASATTAPRSINTPLPGDATMPTLVPLEKLDIAKNYDALNKTASLFLDNFGPAFTNTPQGHIETDIAGASIISGRMLLLGSGTDLTKYKSGTYLIIDNYDAQNQVFRFMMNVAYSMQLDYKDGWATKIPDEHKPLFDPLELIHKLESPFYKACSQTGVGKDYYPYVAALTAMKLISAGKEMKILDLSIGKGIATVYVAMGSRLVA